MFIHKTARGNIPDPNVNPSGLPVMFPLQHEITCHKEAEKSEGGEEDKCSRGERGGQAWCDKQADWYQPLTGMLSAAADWGTSRAVFVFCRWKIQSTHQRVGHILSQLFCNIYKHKKPFMLYLCKFRFRPLLTTTSAELLLKNLGHWKMLQTMLSRFFLPEIKLHLLLLLEKSNRDECRPAIQLKVCCSHSDNLFKLNTTLHRVAHKTQTNRFGQHCGGCSSEKPTLWTNTAHYLAMSWYLTKG